MRLPVPPMARAGSGISAGYDWRSPSGPPSPCRARLPLLAYTVPRGAARALPLHEPTWPGGTAAPRASWPCDPLLPARRSGRSPLCAHRVSGWCGQPGILFIHLNQRGGQGIESDFLLLGGIASSVKAVCRRKGQTSIPWQRDWTERCIRQWQRKERDLGSTSRY